MRPLRILIYAILALGACGGDDWTMPAADHHAFEQQIVVVSSEVNLHCVRLTDAGSLADVRAETARHERAMGDAMGALRADLRPLDRCGGESADGMPGMMDTFDDVLAGHIAALAAVTTLDGVRAERDRYAAAVEMLVRRLLDRWNDLACR